MGIDEYKKVVREHLQQVVDKFNSYYDEWQTQSRCNANFRWGYRRDGRAFLTIDRINLDVYTDEEAKAEQAALAEDLLSKAPVETIVKS